MSVICKVYVSEVRPFGEEKLIKTSCVADNEVMAMYNKDDEDKLFTTASPNGSADMVVSSHLPVRDPSYPYDKWYLMFVKSEGWEVPFTPCKVLAFAPVKVHSITDYGGTSKQVDISTYLGIGNTVDSEFVSQLGYMKRFHHRIMIDNPAAFEQFKAGEQGWWVGVYPCDQFTMHEAVEDAHA